MDVIEKAIRSALEKGDADDRAYRERVYRSAFAALDRALTGNSNILPEVAEKRRTDLQAKVAEIETEFIPAVPAARPEPAQPAAPPSPPPSQPPAPAAPEPSVPVVELDERPTRPQAEEPRMPEAPRPPEAPRAPEVQPIAAPHAPDAPAIAAPSGSDVPSVDAPRGPMVAERAPTRAGRIEPQLEVSPFAGTSRAEPRFSSARAAAEARSNGTSAASEPTLPGSPPAARRSQAERPVPEAFFPDVTDFEAEARPTREPDISAEVSASEGPNVNTERRRPLAGLFIGVTLLALVGIGAWWGISTGLIKLPGAPDHSIVEEVPAEGDDFTPGEETPQPGSEAAPQTPDEIEAERAWIPIFSPADPSTLNAPSDAKAEVIDDDTGNFARIRSGPSGSAIAFDISSGVLEQISGKHVRFAIVARAEEGQETQFSVDCNFAELGDCGRRRFPATYEKRDFLFEIDLPAKAPGAAGTIAIISDLDKAGKAVDVYEIKASISE